MVIEIRNAENDLQRLIVCPSFNVDFKSNVLLAFDEETRRYEEIKFDHYYYESGKLLRLFV